MGRQVGNNIMEAYSKLKNLSGRTDGKPETMAKCKTLLALLCSEYDYDVINVSKMNAQVVIKYYTCISFYLDGVHFRCATQDLRHQWTDLDETLRVYRVDPDIMQRHCFDFRSRPENRKLGYPTIIPCNIFLKISDFSKTETFPN